MLGLNVFGNIPNKARDGGHRHISHLSLTDKRSWSVTSDYRPHDYVVLVTQVLKNSVHNTVAKRVARDCFQRKHAGDTNMEKLRCQRAFSVRAVRAGKNARLSADVVQNDGTEQNSAPIRV